MEYAKRRKRRRRNSSGAGRAIGALIMIGAIIYLFTASAAGKWLAEEVMAPAFSALAELPVFNSSSLDELEQESSGSANPLSVSLNSGLTSVNENIELPAMSCFALQMGAFSSDENAASLSGSLQKQGGGGYVYNDNGMYRVLASGYSTEAEAKDVKTQLKNAGTDCTVYDLSAPAVTFSITAGKDDMQNIRDGFHALYEAQAALCSACIQFDEDSMSPSEGAALVDSIRAQLTSDCDVLYKYADSAPVVASIVECCNSCISVLSNLSAEKQASSVDFSAAMKHALLDISASYSSMLQNIGV